MAQPLLFSPLSTSSSRATILVCHSSSSKPISVASNPQPQSTTLPTPSLADQLRPLSHTILKDHRPQTASDETDETQLQPSRKPRSTWVNPSRPRRKVLSLQRQHRTSPSSAPDLKLLPIVSRNLTLLNLSEDVDDVSALASFSSVLHDAFPDPPTQDTAVAFLRELHPWHNAYRFFEWLKAGSFFQMETIFYNMIMKSLSLGRRYDLVERLAQEMVDTGVGLDNITYSTVITAAKHNRRFDTAIGWFERMYESGLPPDEVTVSAVMDVYAKVGRTGEAISLFERGRDSGWTPDAVAFAVLGRMFGSARDYEGIKYVISEMKNLGIQRNVVVYNTLLDGLGKVGKPGEANKLFDEMLEAGLAPDERTLTALFKIYRNARWSRDAMNLWERIKLNKWPVDVLVYNTVLSAFGSFGLEDEAQQLFLEMNASEKFRPDSWSYTAMVNLYATKGEGDKALQVFDGMLKQGFKPTVMTTTCLIQCYGKAGRVDDVVRVFDVAMKQGIRPDDHLRCCLLSLISACQEVEMNKVMACLDKVGPRFVKLIRLLSSDDAHFSLVREEFRSILNEASAECRKPISNCFIDVCRNRNFPPHRAQELFSLGIVFGIYPNLHSKIFDEWSLDLRSLSVGAACTAFEVWVSNLAAKINTNDALPLLFSVHTGSGQGLTSAFASYLNELAAPFRVTEEGRGHFTVSREELISWLQKERESLN